MRSVTYKLCHLKMHTEPCILCEANQHGWPDHTRSHVSVSHQCIRRVVATNLRERVFCFVMLRKKEIAFGDCTSSSSLAAAPVILLATKVSSHAITSTEM
jgi:hypothetical protein